MFRIKKKKFLPFFTTVFFSIVKNINPLKYKGGGGWLPTPPPLGFSEFFFSKRIKHQHLTLSVTVRLYLAHFKTSSVMVSFHGYEIRRHK